MLNSYNTWRSCLKSCIWLWMQFLVIYCIYHTNVSVEVIKYMKIMFEVMNLTMNTILSDALFLSHIFLVLKSYNTWRSCLKSWIWLWMQFLVMHSVFIALMIVLKSYNTWRSCLKSWIWIWMHFLVMHCVYDTYYSVEVMWYFCI